MSTGKFFSFFYVFFVLWFWYDYKASLLARKLRHFCQLSTQHFFFKKRTWYLNQVRWGVNRTISNEISNGKMEIYRTQSNDWSSIAEGDWTWIKLYRKILIGSLIELKLNTNRTSIEDNPYIVNRTQSKFTHVWLRLAIKHQSSFEFNWFDNGTFQLTLPGVRNMGRLRLKNIYQKFCF